LIKKFEKYGNVNYLEDAQKMVTAHIEGPLRAVLIKMRSGRRVVVIEHDTQ